MDPQQGSSRLPFLEDTALKEPFCWFPCDENSTQCYDLQMGLVEKAMSEDRHGVGSL
jgi:hypothetical protein